MSWFRSLHIPSQSDVVVLGGGIVGCAAAYYLARGGTQVVLVDKGEIAFEQSSRNWGWVRQNGRNLRELPVGILSRRLWGSLEADLGADLGWASEGNLHLGYTAAEMSFFDRWRQGAAKVGLTTEILDRADVARLYPGISDDHLGGIYCPTDGQADPHRVAPALAAAAAEHGAQIATGCAALGIELGDGRVRALRTEFGAIRTSTVIVAAGAWSSRFLWPLGVRLPQRKMRTTVSATIPLGKPTSRLVLWARHLAIRQDHRGSVVLARGGGRVPLDLEVVRFRGEFSGTWSDSERREKVPTRAGRESIRDLLSLRRGAPSKRFWNRVRAEEPPPDPDNARRALEHFRRIVPAHHKAEHERVWAGNIDYLPDAVPVIDCLDSPRGLVIATGFSGHGFALGPAGGLLAAELALGEVPSAELKPFRLSRFADGETLERELHF